MGKATHGKEIKKTCGHDSNCNCGRLRSMYQFSPSSQGEHGENRFDGPEVHQRTPINAENDVRADSQEPEGGFDQPEPRLEWVVSFAERRIKEITNTIKENFPMPIQPPSSERSETPVRSRNTNSQPTKSGFPTLKVADVDFNRKQCKVIDAKEPPAPNTYKNAIILKVAYDGKTFLWNLKGTNPCFKVLYESLQNGQDANEWVGLSFLLYLETDEFSGQNFMRVQLTDAGKKKGRG